MELTVNQALVLISAEIAKAGGPIKNTTARQARHLVINVGKLGVGDAVIMTVKDPPKKRGGRGLKQPNTRKADAKSVSDTVGRRSTK